MWEFPAYLDMTDAAQDARIELQLVNETQCAAAFYTHNIKDRLSEGFKKGDNILIADVGPLFKS